MATTMPIWTDTCAAMAIMTPLRACSALTSAFEVMVADRVCRLRRTDTVLISPEFARRAITG